MSVSDLDPEIKEWIKQLVAELPPITEEQVEAAVRLLAIPAYSRAAA